MIKEEDLKELVTKENRDEKLTNIYYDSKKQIYTIRIPTDYAREVGLDEKKDKFRFVLITLPSKEGDKKPKFKLIGEIAYGQK